MSGQFKNSGEDYGRSVPIFERSVPQLSFLPHSGSLLPDAVGVHTDSLPLWPGAGAVWSDTLPPVDESPTLLLPSSPGTDWRAKWKCWSVRATPERPQGACRTGASPVPTNADRPDILEPPRRRPRRRRSVLSIVLVVLLVLVSAIGFFFYVNRSTPDKTLDNFCMALQRGDYQTAYQQFSPKMQDILSEKMLASAFIQDRLAQCTYAPTGELGSSVQTDLKLVYVSKLMNADQVILARDGGNVWRIDDVYMGSSGKESTQAAVYHLTLSVRQALRDLTGVFKSGEGGADTGVQVKAGERVEMFATGSAAVGSASEPMGPEGSSRCAANLVLEPSLPCYAVIYSLSLAGRARAVGVHSEFMATTDGSIFLGINASGLAQVSGTFQLTIVTIPDGTATGLWETPDDGFVTQEQNVSLSVQILSQHDSVSRVSFFVMNSRGEEMTICTAKPGRTGRAVCVWDLTVAGAPITNGPITLGFTISAQHQLVRDPDGMRRGVARYVHTQVTGNWAGYGAEDFNKSMRYESTTVNWTVPQIACAPGEDSATSIWAGLMGVPNKSQLAQTGVGTSCEAGVPSYYAWWEMYPALPVQISYQVQPGDAMTASVVYQQGEFQLILDDESEHWYFSTMQVGADSDAISAECIVEAPLNVQEQQTFQLSNFGSVSLSCQVNDQPIGVTGPQNVLYQMAGPEQYATASVLDQLGAGFTVQWKSS